jgi:hypothetical protein
LARSAARLDFVRAASFSPGGVSLLVLPAARIVRALSGPVATPRSEAGVIVTERGAADLRGCNLRNASGACLPFPRYENMNPKRTPNLLHRQAARRRQSRGISCSSARIRPRAACAASCPDLAEELGRRLEARVEHVTSPGAAGSPTRQGRPWDVGLHRRRAAARGGDRLHARLPEIPATYLVPCRLRHRFASRRSIGRACAIAVSARSAYDLFLSRSLKHAQLVRAEGIPASYDLFVAEKLDVLPGCCRGSLRMSRACRARASSKESSRPFSRRSAHPRRARPARHI